MIERRKKISVEFNIAPLIDVVFQLLLFFALTAYFVANPGIEVSLPNAKSAAPTDATHIVVYITKAGTVYFNSEQVEISQLSEKLKTTQSHTTTAILKSDEQVQLGLVVKVIDAIKQGGLKELVIATERNSEQ
ncbi:MAG: biopolymer transporter ExbD [Spirochaetes bacterium]|nr:biopolymer transporter ExbD [Spirochaetota bacterium]